jgi:hypothetical protein
MIQNGDSFWHPASTQGDALSRICERAFLADPERTYADLVDMGHRELAMQLRADFQTGRLQENVPQPVAPRRDRGPAPQFRLF